MKTNESHDWNHHLIGNDEYCDDGVVFWILCSIKGCRTKNPIHL